MALKVQAIEDTESNPQRPKPIPINKFDRRVEQTAEDSDAPMVSSAFNPRCICINIVLQDLDVEDRDTQRPERKALSNLFSQASKESDVENPPSSWRGTSSRRDKKPAVILSEESDSDVEIIEVNMKKKLPQEVRPTVESRPLKRRADDHGQKKPAAVKSKSDGVKVNQKVQHMCVLPFLFDIFHHNMLTLDRMTLFFFTLSQTYKGKVEPGESAMVSNWASTIPADSRPRAKAGSNASTPTLTSGHSSRTRASKAPPSTVRSSLTNNVRIFSKSDVVPDSEDEGPVSDRDETNGAERDFAAMSLPKAKGTRMASTVRCLLFPSLQRSYVIPRFQSKLKSRQRGCPMIDR